MNKFLVNYSSLTIAQVFNSFVLLVSYPYLVNKIGIETYGVIVVTQALSDFVMIFTNFGFEISALKVISRIRKHTDIVNKVLTNVFIVKSFVFLITIVPALFIGIYILDIKNIFFLIAFVVSGFFSALTPYFFFQGVEKMNYILYLKVFLGSLYIALILLLIHDKADFLNVAYIKLTVEFLTFLLSAFLLKNVFKFKLSPGSFNDIILLFKESSAFFSSKLANIFNTKIPIFFTSIVFGSSATTILDFVIKLFSIGQIPIDILASIIFPKTALNFEKLYVKKMIFYNFITAFFIVFAINIFLELFLNLLLPNILYSSVYFYIFIYGFVLIFNSINSLLGTSVLVVNGYTFHYNFSVYLSSFVLVILLSFSYLSNSILLVYVSLIVSSLSLLVYRVVVSFRHKLL